MFKTDNMSVAQTTATAILLLGLALILPELTILDLNFNDLPETGVIIMQLALVVYAFDMLYRNLVYDYRG